MFDLNETPMPEHAPKLHRLAELTLGSDECWPELQTVYESDDRLRAPKDWMP